MPGWMTYTSLLEDVQSYLERGGSTDPAIAAQLPRLVNLAQDAIIQQLHVQGQIEVDIFTLQVGQPVYAKPDRWRETVSVNIRVPQTGGGARVVALKPRTYEYLNSYWPDRTATDQPVYYGDYDQAHWLIVPTPQLAYAAEVQHYAKPPPLSDVVQENWLTQRVPNLLLYRTLLETEPFLKNDERLPVWQALYTEALTAMKKGDVDKMADRTVMRTSA